MHKWFFCFKNNEITVDNKPLSGSPDTSKQKLTHARKILSVKFGPEYLRSLIQLSFNRRFGDEQG